MDATVKEGTIYTLKAVKEPDGWITDTTVKEGKHTS
jgi:hypothetical protein